LSLYRGGVHHAAKRVRNWPARPRGRTGIALVPGFGGVPRARRDGNGPDVAYDVAEHAWEPFA